MKTRGFEQFLCGLSAGLWDAKYPSGFVKSTLQQIITYRKRDCVIFYRKRFIPVKKWLGINNGETLYSFKHIRCIHLVEDGEKLHNIIKLTRQRTLAELMDYLKDMGVILGDEINFKSRSI